MRSQDINLIGGSNVDDSLSWLCEDTVNYVIEKSPSSGALTEYKLRDAPGLKPFVKAPVLDGIAAGPVRGAHDCEGKHFTVMGSKLYQITPGRIAVPLGTVPGTQRVNMAHNQIPGGNQVIVTTGTPNGYVWNTVTELFTRITDPGYPGGGAVDYVDTYLVSVEPFGRYWFWSDQASATSYNTLNRTEAEADPDSIVSIAVNSFEVVVFGQQTVEFFYNAGGINGNQFKSKRVMNGHGCAARDSVVKLDNTLFWLGVDGIVYRLNGYAAQPVSTPQFTQRIRDLNWSKAFAFSYEDQGHVMYCITFPDGPTFTFDVPVAAMTRRASYGLNRWRLNTLIKTGGKWIGGDFQSGLLYELDWYYPMEGEGTPLVRERTSGNTFNAHNKIEVPLLELLFGRGGTGSSDAGGSIPPIDFVDQPTGPIITGDAPDADIGVFYTYSYAITVGDAPIEKVEVVSGSIPEGMSVSILGVLFGTPVSDGSASYTFTIRATDENRLFSEVTNTISMEAFVSAYLPLNTDFTDLTGRSWAQVDAVSPVSCQPTPTADGLGSMEVDLTFNFPSQFGIKSALASGAPGTGPFCVEGYFYVGSVWNPSVTGQIGLTCFVDNTTHLSVRIRRPLDTGDTTPVFEIYDGTTSAPNTREALNKEQWYHWAISRDLSGDCWLFINGKKSALPLNSSLDVSSIFEVWLGCAYGAAYSFIRNIDNCRLTTGWSRYSADFTPPPAPMPPP